MIDQIGESAGAVWRHLNEHGASAPQQINEFLKLDETLFLMAIGWLAREGKLVFEGEGTKLIVSLRPE
jgi:hypothetical protein